MGGPAIGDVNADGLREIVVNLTHSTRVYGGDGLVKLVRSYGNDQYLARSPALGDLDLNGDLEIAVTTDQGRLYVFHHNGTDLSGWPWQHPSGLALASPVIAEVYGGFEPELVVGVHDGSAPEVHCFHYFGTEVVGYPRSQNVTDGEYATPIVDILGSYGTADICRGAHDSAAYAWDTFGADLPGWPTTLISSTGGGAACLTSAASGDLDGDGRVEVVFITSYPTEMLVYDMGRPVVRTGSNLRKWWPMYGYNPLRQSCLACDADGVTAVPHRPAEGRGVRFDPPSPNPARGPVSLHFSLPEPAPVRLTIFDAAGRRVRQVIKAELQAGTQQATWDGRTDDGSPAAAGVYYLRLTADGGAGSAAVLRKVVLER
jgi:hypothetical protein